MEKDVLILLTETDVNVPIPLLVIIYEKLLIYLRP